MVDDWCDEVCDLEKKRTCRVKKYVKKPIPVEAFQYEGCNLDECMAFCPNLKLVDDDDSKMQYPVIGTLEGEMKVEMGSYIVKGILGEFWAVRKDIFEKTYEEVMPDEQF